MTSAFFTYNKQKVIQALRYHFISRREIKIMIILVNVFAILSAILFAAKKILPLPFLVSSMLWFILMITFWYLLPAMVYKKAPTFKDRLRAILTNNEFRIENERGGRSWEWREFSNWIESPYFFHLYFNSRSFFIVPKDAFTDEDVLNARAMLNEKIKKGF
ncbi:MAG: YcxB family protein [Bacteroidetes bacterium]|nr:YcxB family protein [Bacteroidota bacterium]